MKPESITEQLMFNTVRLETNHGSGTGFFFKFRIEEITVPILVTNKHVVNNNQNEVVKFFLHLLDDNGESKTNYEITVQTDWIFHSNKDLCFTFINPVFEEVKKRTGKEVFFIGNDENLIPDEKALTELSALEEIVMIGYPIGLWDKKNNYPIFRKGFTASHPAYDFNENGIGVADIAAFPGSSGSPIYILNEGSHMDKKGNIYMGSSRLIFLGILYAGPTINAQGEISVVDIPTQQKVISRTSIMTNLGYYIKSQELLEFKKIVKEALDNEI
ncbi:trypsin-like peptidase domain-containing protein [Dolosigranulum pigrum]|uniref:trypsin-like peptidase domain-containing protein n=1 Tax=Dolosigranulum pigrum TaxID=29394 RepID=UPI0015EB90E9|nr:trypsin-like peptidase domain-containing protein [Dolosigranulum pigrum]